MDKQELSAIDLDIQDNRIILTAENHEMAVIFARGLVSIMAAMGPQHILVKEDEDGKPVN